MGVPQEGPAHGLDAGNPAEISPAVERQVRVVRKQQRDAEKARVKKRGKDEKARRGDVHHVGLHLFDHGPPLAFVVDGQHDLLGVGGGAGDGNSSITYSDPEMATDVLEYKLKCRAYKLRYRATSSGLYDTIVP